MWLLTGTVRGPVVAVEDAPTCTRALEANLTFFSRFPNVAQP